MAEDNRIPGGMPPPPPRPFGPPPGSNTPDASFVPPPQKPEQEPPQKPQKEEKKKKVKKTDDTDLFEDSLSKAKNIAKRKTIKTIVVSLLLLLFIGGGTGAFVFIFNSIGYDTAKYQLNVSLTQPTNFTVTSTVIEPGGVVEIENPIAVFVPKNEEQSKLLNSLACFAMEVQFNKITSDGGKINVNNLFSVEVPNAETIYALDEFNYKEIGNKQFIDIPEGGYVFYQNILEAGKEPFELVSGFMLKGNGNSHNNDDSFNHNAYAGDTIEITVTVYSAFPSKESIKSSSIGTHVLPTPESWINIVESKRIEIEGKGN